MVELADPVGAAELADPIDAAELVGPAGGAVRWLLIGVCRVHAVSRAIMSISSANLAACPIR